MNINELKAAWNAKSDDSRPWDQLSFDEIILFAQKMEREACAELFEGVHTDTCPGINISNEIRKRSNAK